MQRKSGFTLIELLIVLGIISILLSMSLASIAKARVRTRDSKRIADMRTIQSALEQFAVGDPSHTYPADPTDATASKKGIYNNSDFNAYLSVTPIDPQGKQYSYFRPACITISNGKASMAKGTANPSDCTANGGIYNSSYGLHIDLETDNMQEARNDNSPTDATSYDLMP